MKIGIDMDFIGCSYCLDRKNVSTFTKKVDQLTHLCGTGRDKNPRQIIDILRQRGIEVFFIVPGNLSCSDNNDGKLFQKWANKNTLGFDGFIYTNDDIREVVKDAKLDVIATASTPNIEALEKDLNGVAKVIDFDPYAHIRGFDDTIKRVDSFDDMSDTVQKIQTEAKVSKIEELKELKEELLSRTTQKEESYSLRLASSHGSI